MAEPSLRARSPLDNRRPAPPVHEGPAGVQLAERPAGRLTTVLARHGQAAALTERCQGFGVALPATPRRLTGRGYAVTWTGPGQWLVEADEIEGDRLQRLFGSFASLCSTVTTDDARLVLSVGGPKARATLGKMLPIDLHPRAFRPGDAAITVAGGMSVILWRRDDEDTFDCAVPRSYARSFWDWLLDSAAEYGWALEAAP